MMMGLLFGRFPNQVPGERGPSRKMPLCTRKRVLRGGSSEVPAGSWLGNLPNRRSPWGNVFLRSTLRSSKSWWISQQSHWTIFYEVIKATSIKQTVSPIAMNTSKSACGTFFHQTLQQKIDDSVFIHNTYNMHCATNKRIVLAMIEILNTNLLPYCRQNLNYYGKSVQKMMTLALIFWGHRASSKATKLFLTDFWLMLMKATSMNTRLAFVKLGIHWHLHLTTHVFATVRFVHSLAVEYFHLIDDHHEYPTTRPPLFVRIWSACLHSLAWHSQILNAIPLSVY